MNDTPPPKLIKDTVICSLRDVLATLFTIRSSGFGVPIAVSLLLAIAPIILLYQQNTLIALQGRISDKQTELMSLQTLAARFDQARQLYQDIAKDAQIISRLETARSVYDKAKTLSVKVEGRAKKRDGSSSPLEFEQTVVARNYDLDLCGVTFPSTLREVGWLESKCNDVEPFKLIDNLKSNEFEKGTYGKTVITWVYYLQKISVLNRDALNGHLNIEKDVDSGEIYLPDIIKDAALPCRVDPLLVSNSLNRARTLRSLERAAQQVGWLFQFGFSGGDQGKPNDLDKELDDQFDGSRAEFLTATEELVEDANVPPEQRYKLFAVTTVVSSAMGKMVGDIDTIIQACKTVRDANSRILAELDPVK